MQETTDIKIENKLLKEKRDINIYHQSSRSAHIISRNSSITVSLGPGDRDDYLHISVVTGAGHLWKDCLIDVPAWLDFQLASDGKAVLTHSADRKRILIKIPPGPPTWYLKITRAPGSFTGLEPDYVVIGDVFSKCS